MSLDPNQIKQEIRAKLMELAGQTDADASELSDEDIIPATGLFDSSAILELVVWFEKTYDLPLKQEEINIDNLGSIDAMAAFLLARKSG
jgi:acyl carrier protein